ncbi:hypothetical protein TrCOL_g4583 [Triparma columacea]|uniref:Uncharacterized protein n=1 Tax=Triparma columacea TaxID=722753 RepID=A0A9W7LAY2_9STRA|nr:hypothetical protein TrCOL_g4583 [Triparma columacea]
MEPDPPKGSGSYVTWSNVGTNKVTSSVRYEGPAVVGKGGYVGNEGTWEAKGVGSGWEGGGMGEEIDGITEFRTYKTEGTKANLMGMEFGIPGGGGGEGYYGITVFKGDLWIEWDGKGGIGGYVKVQG